MADGRRRWGAWLVGLAVILVILWLGYWFAARSAAETAIARVNGAPVGNADVACTGPAVGGFPFILDVRCERITYAAAAEAITASLGGVWATAPLYWPGSVAARIESPLVVNAPAAGLAVTTSWSVGNATASAWLGGLTGISAEFVGFAAENSGGSAGLPLARVTAAEASGGISPAGGGAFTLRADAAQLKLMRPDGSALPDLDATAEVTLLDVGSTLGTDPAETILAWLRKGGTARIDRLRIAGKGAVITSDGQMTIAPDGRLSGSLLLRWNDIAKVADLIEAIRPGSRERAETPLQMINAFSMPVETPEGRYQQASLALVNGVVVYNMIPLPIDPIPPLKF